MPPSQSTALETRHWYTLSDEIASGGMASIHLGLRTAPHGLSRVVAIKQLHPVYAQNREFVEMFRDEVRVASRVIHPNVVPILDVVTATEQFFLVMEYVHGLSVSHLQKAVGSAIPNAIATTIIVGVLHGLHAAHEARSEKGEPLRIIHRDVTPQNVVVGIDGTPRVLDFGIAHALGRMQTTRIGQLKGKLAYMAPEQLDDLPLDRRVDIYSATVMFWEMLTGRKLFSGRQSDRISQLNLGHVVEAPSLFQPEIPSVLDDIVLKGLQPSPDGRYATAREMAIALEDNVPLVSASQLGDWVKQIWGAALDERVLQLMSIERADDDGGDPDPRTVRDAPPLMPATTEAITASGSRLHWEGATKTGTTDQPRAARASGENTASTVRMMVPNLVRAKRAVAEPAAKPSVPSPRGKWALFIERPTPPRVWKAVDSAVVVVMAFSLVLFMVTATHSTRAARARAATTPAHAPSTSTAAIAAPVPGAAAVLTTPDGGASAPATAATLITDGAPTIATASQGDAANPATSAATASGLVREEKARRRNHAPGRANGRTPVASPTGRALHARRSPSPGPAAPNPESPSAARDAPPAQETCDPPFFFDRSGIKRFKITCL